MQLYFNKRKSTAIGIVVLLLISCVTTKRKDDLSTIGKIYHNTTARYNGYFNATELYKESRQRILNQYQDNYTKLLPLYPEMTSDNAKTVADDMDEAIKKLSVVINLHRTSKWIDDSYLLIGKAQFLKQDYQKAKETFQYLIDEFDPDNRDSNSRKITSAKSKKAQQAANKSRRTTPKKSADSRQKEKTQRQKQKERAQQIKDRKKAAKKSKSSKSKSREDRTATAANTDKAAEVKTSTPKTNSSSTEAKEKEAENNKGMFAHEPAYYQGLIWLARTYTIQGYHLNASNLMTELKNKSAVSADVIKEMEKARAHSFIELEDYPAAITALEKAYANSDDKEEQARFAFILGQLQMKAKDYSNAQRSFENVLAGRGNYEMDFNAKLLMTQLGIYSGKRDEKAAIASIEKMIKDQKNIEYRDQLYYTLAQIQLEKGNKPEAKELLKKAVAQKSNNQIRKAESYYLLADLYYGDEEYVLAKTYFDTTLQVLPQIDERYPRVKNLSENLTEIAANIETIARLDSFIMVSKMSDQDKRKLAQKIKKEREAEAALAEAQQEQSQTKSTTMSQLRASNPLVSQGNSSRSSNFFAYDEKELKRGFKEFKSQWGNRALEDNWRRSSRADANLSGIVAEDTGEEVEEQLLAKNEVDDILRDIPKNAQDVERLNIQIEEAMFELGRLFREKLENYEKSSSYLEDLLARNPETPKKIDAYYYLYLNYLSLDQNQKAKIYYDKILAEAPDSEFAKVLQDPDYFKSQEDMEGLVYTFYDQTYILFEEGNYEETMSRIKESNQFKENPIKAKFALLNSFCIGKTEGKEAYINSLKELVANYPKTPEQTHAKELLRILYGGKPVANNSSILRYTYENDILHYAIVILYNLNGKTTNKARTVISDFNKKYYKAKKLKAISSINLDTENNIPMLIIRDFASAEEAMGYYNVVEKNIENFLDASYEYEVYVASQRNYREIYKTKKVEEYKGFFEENYLNK